MITMWRQNPTRFVEYIATCALGEDLFDMRRVVREKATAIIKERQLGVAPAQALPGAVLGCEYGETVQEPASSSASKD
jgi:hypothetical protein